MPLYDFLAPAYDLAFEKIYRPFRERAFRRLPDLAGACVLDLACGTGQNFPLLAQRVGKEGHIIGLDISHGMLHRARRRANLWPNGPRWTLIHAPAADLSSALLERSARRPRVDFILCTYGFTSMRQPEAAFRASWNVLKPGGGYGILDIYAARPTLHARAVEWTTRSRFTSSAWHPLSEASADFRMDYLEPSAHLFGGKLFGAWGTKPRPPQDPRHGTRDQQGRQTARAL